MQRTQHLPSWKELFFEGCIALIVYYERMYTKSLGEVFHPLLKAPSKFFFPQEVKFSTKVICWIQLAKIDRSLNLYRFWLFMVFHWSSPRVLPQTFHWQERSCLAKRRKVLYA